MSEEKILAATVGERQPLNDSITLAPYDPRWPGQFRTLARKVREALGDVCLSLEHVGSTAVAGMPAKPIIDMLLVVADSSREELYVTALEGVGFRLRIREPDWHEHRMLKSEHIEANLHVFSEGCGEIERMLLFRDWLREHEEDRRLYHRRKQELASRTWKYTQNYADAKSGVVEEILGRTGSAQKAP
jgi:GrpB-like predicted nucleotidyltransferase (UPF0157 family)